MADNNDPVFQIQRVYMKEASLEQPNSPAILLEQEQPSVDIQLGVEAQQAADGMFEVAVTATVTTKIKDRTVFLVEVKQAGIFEIRNIPPTRCRPSWASPARRSSTPTCAANVADMSRAPASRRCTWPRSTSSRCTSSSRPSSSRPAPAPSRIITSA
jgi:preprotein translocase subunit SecB